MKVLTVILSLLLSSSCAIAQLVCTPGGIPAWHVEAFPTWNDAAARIVQLQGKNGIVQVITDRGPVLIITEFSQGGCPAPPFNPGRNTMHWNLEKYDSYVEVESRHAVLIAEGATDIRVVSSQWGLNTNLSPPPRRRATSLPTETHTSFIPPAFYIVWYKEYAD